MNYKEKDERAEDMIKLLDYYYDPSNDSPLIQFVDKKSMIDKIDTLREEYGIFYVPHNSTAISSNYVKIPTERYNTYVKESICLENLIRILEDNFDVFDFSSKEAIIAGLSKHEDAKAREFVSKYIKHQETRKKSDIDNLFDALKKLEKDVNEEGRLKRAGISLRSVKECFEKSSDIIEQSIKVYIETESNFNSNTESFMYSIVQTADKKYRVTNHHISSCCFNSRIYTTVCDVINYFKDQLRNML